MKNEVLLYSEFHETTIVEKALLNFSVKSFKLSDIKKKNYKNKNILILLKNESDADRLKKILLNNSVLCLVNQNNIQRTFNKTTVLSSPLTLSRFKELANKIFKTVTIEYLDILINEKKITNKINKKYTYFTDLETKIFSELLQKKELDKKFLKENILKIKNNIDTRSVESHFSRIRKKLLLVNSLIKITSKGDVFYIN